jgi:septin family protein
MGFEKLEEGMVNLANRSYDSSFASNHIFYQHLKNAKQKTKDNYFETFREYLNYLNVNELDSYMQQLKEHGYTFNQNLIRTYLTEVKRQSAAFVTNLKAAIQ